MYQKINDFCQTRNVVLVAVSKTKPIEAIKEKYELGHRIFGENRVQELVEKNEILPKDIEWHMIGNLQRNKVKYIAPFINLIHSVDSLKLLNEIQKEALKNQRVISILLQLKIASETTKAGLAAEEVREILEKYLSGSFPNVQIKGLMGMASFTDNTKVVRDEFRQLNILFKELQEWDNIDQKTFTIKSMGMSQDYQLAIEEGSNMVRIGSLLFGAR